MRRENKIKLKSYLKNRNLKRFLIFLLISFLFLVLTKFSETYTQTFVFGVKIEDLKDEVNLLKDSTSQLEVVLKGKGFSLLPYVFYKSKEVTLRSGKDTFKKNDYLHWDALNNKHLLRSIIPNSIDILSVTPDTLSIKYVTLSSRKVPIIVDDAISFAPGYDLSQNLRLSSDSVKLVGPSELLKDVDHIKTLPVVLKNTKENIQLNVKLDNPFQGSISFFPEEISVYGDVKQFTEGYLNLPITIRNLPSGTEVNYFPKDAELYYYVDLEHYASVGKEDFELFVDFSEMEKQENRYLPIQINSKNNIVKSTRLSQIKIEFIILN